MVIDDEGGKWEDNESASYPPVYKAGPAAHPGHPTHLCAAGAFEWLRHVPFGAWVEELKDIALLDIA